MKRNKLLAALAGVTTLAVTLTACGSKGDNATDDKKPDTELKDQTVQIIKGESPDKLPDAAKNRKDTLIIGIDAPDGVFNPIYSESAYDNYVNGSMFAGLLDVKKDGDVEPGLAEKYEISQDGKTYTFTLRKDLKWSDGQPITTDDVELSFLIKADKSYDGPSDLSSIGIKGFKDYNEGSADKIAGIEKVDKQVIKITLDEVNASAIYDLAGAPLPKHFYGKLYKKGEADKLKEVHRKPEVFSGAYKLKEYKEGQTVTLVANENYYKGKAKIPNLVFKTTNKNTAMQLLETGEVDINALTVKAENVEQVKSKGFLDAHIFPTNGYGYMAFNQRSPKFKDPKVRQAMAYALNRKAVVDTVYKGYADVINIPQSKVSWAYTDENVEHYDYNTEKANQLLDEAGWKKGANGIREKDGVKLEIKFLASTPNEVNEAIIPIATDDYKAVGIDFKPEQMDFNTVRSKVKARGLDYDMYFMAWGLTPEPDVATIFKTNGSQNENGYSNPKVDELLKKGTQVVNKDERKKVYQEMYRELNKDLPYIFMYQRRDMWVTNSRVKNFQVSPYRDFTYDFEKYELQQ